MDPGFLPVAQSCGGFLSYFPTLISEVTANVEGFYGRAGPEATAFAFIAVLGGFFPLFLLILLSKRKLKEGSTT